MKMPNPLKLPRKLKKEVKKGFTRNVYNSPMKLSSNPFETSVSSFFNYTYSGGNTKAFFRLCKAMRKEEKCTMKLVINKMIESWTPRTSLWSSFYHCIEQPNLHFDTLRAKPEHEMKQDFLQSQGVHLTDDNIHCCIPPTSF